MSEWRLVIFPKSDKLEVEGNIKRFVDDKSQSPKNVKEIIRFFIKIQGGDNNQGDLTLSLRLKYFWLVSNTDSNILSK